MRGIEFYDGREFVYWQTNHALSVYQLEDPARLEIAARKNEVLYVDNRKVSQNKNTLGSLSNNVFSPTDFKKNLAKYRRLVKFYDGREFVYWQTDAKEKRGGHKCYEIRRQLEKTEAYNTDIEVSDCVDYLRDLEYAIYDRAGFDAEDFARLKAIASDSVTRLLGNAALVSEVDIKSVKSLSSELHLCAPYSSDAHATPALSEIKYNDISETSDNVNNSKLSSTSSITENEKNRFYDGREFVYWQTPSLRLLKTTPS